MTTLDVTLRPAEEQDLDAIVGLLEDIEKYYGATHVDSSEILAGQTRRALFGDFPIAQALVCFEGSSRSLIGFASYSFLWPASGATHTLFVKELFVAESHRGNGLGKLLFEQILQIAKSRADCSRVEWTADRDNPTATRFYAAQGFEEHEGKVYYRWSKPEQ